MVSVILTNIEAAITPKKRNRDTGAAVKPEAIIAVNGLRKLYVECCLIEGVKVRVEMVLSYLHVSAGKTSAILHSQLTTIL